MRRGISEREDAILQKVYLYRYLTVEQVTRIFFAPSSKNLAGEYLKHLADMSYLGRFHLPLAKPGNSQFVYYLTSKGFSYLKSLGIAAYGFIRQKEEPSFLHLQHILGLNDIFVAADRIADVDPQLSISRILPDWMIKKMQLPFPGSVIPDGVIDVQMVIDDKKIHRIRLAEYDRCTEDEKQYRKKVRGLVAALASAAFVEVFGNGIVSVVANGKDRCERMCEWTKLELEHMGKAEMKKRFLFTSLPESGVTPSLFVQSVWRSPGFAELLPLIPV